MNINELKMRRLTNHHLITPSDKLTVVRDLCGVQAQFMSNAIHSLKIRCRDFDEAAVGEGLVKNWTVRGTVHVFAQDDLPLFINCNGGRSYRRNEWNEPSFWNQRKCWALTPERQSYLSDVILAALESQPRERDELKQICRDHGMTEAEEGSMFDPWGGGIRELCERGFINYVVQEKKAFCLSPEFTPMPEEQAELDLARRYFTAFGPATVHDAMYFFHATSKQVRAWLEQLPVTTAECDGRTYYCIESGRAYTGEIPRVLFLAGFDQLMLGYEKKESLYLAPEHMRAIFNLAGIVMPAVMLDGNIVGRWKKKGGSVTVELFARVVQDDLSAITDKAQKLWNDITRLDIKIV